MKGIQNFETLQNQMKLDGLVRFLDKNLIYKCVSIYFRRRTYEFIYRH